MSREPEPCCTPPHPRAVPWQDADDFDLALFKEQQGYEPSHRNIRVELTIAQVEPLLAENAATRHGRNNEVEQDREYLRRCVSQLGGSTGPGSKQPGFSRDEYGLKLGYKPAKLDELPFYEKHMGRAARRIAARTGLQQLPAAP